MLCSLLLINLIIAVLLDKLHESQENDSKLDKFSDLQFCLIDLGYPKSVAEFMTSYDLNITSAHSHIPLHKQLSQKLLSLLKCPKAPSTTSRYLSHALIKPLYLLVNHPLFHLSIFTAIILNTITLCFDYYELDGGYDRPRVLEFFNYVFMAIFTIEVLLKLVGLGLREFVRDRFNLFDTLVVIMSIVEVVISDGSGATSSLRAFRLFRIFKIFRVGNLRIMLDSLTKTIQSIGNYVVLLVLFIYVFALMGMQFFAGKLKFNEEGQPDMDNGKDRRYNFNTIDVTFLTIFQLLIGDNWNDLMYDVVRVTSDVSVLYFIVITVIVTLVMVNLLIAIVISNFDSSRIYATKQKMIDELKKRREEGYSPYEAAKLVLGSEVTRFAYHQEKENALNGGSVSLENIKMNNHDDISSKSMNEIIV